jgi:predicted amidophosphoribosyltransferase
MMQAIASLRTTRIAKGVCIECGTHSIFDKKRCKRCAEKHAESKASSFKKLYQQRVENGVCTICGATKARQGVKTCADCARKANAISKHSRAKRNNRTKANP